MDGNWRHGTIVWIIYWGVSSGHLQLVRLGDGLYRSASVCSVKGARRLTRRPCRISSWYYWSNAAPICGDGCGVQAASARTERPTRTDRFICFLPLARDICTRRSDECFYRNKIGRRSRFYRDPPATACLSASITGMADWVIRLTQFIIPAFLLSARHCCRSTHTSTHQTVQTIAPVRRSLGPSTGIPSGIQRHQYFAVLCKRSSACLASCVVCMLRSHRQSVVYPWRNWNDEL